MTLAGSHGRPPPWEPIGSPQPPVSVADRVAISHAAPVEHPPPPTRATSVVGDYLRFWRGTAAYRPSATPTTWWFLPLWGFSLTLAYASSVFFTIIVTAAGGETPDNAVGELVQSGPVLTLILTAVVVAPLIEEVAFRLPMSLRPWHVAGGIGVLSVMFVPSLFGVSLGQGIAGEDSPAVAALVELALLVGIIGLLGLILRRLLPRERTSGPALVPPRARYAVIVALTLLFAGAHLGNFSELTWFLPAFILPQLLVGMVLAYVRVVRAWWLAVAVHALNNAVAVGFGLIGRSATGETAQALAGLAILGAIAMIGLASSVALGVNAYLTWSRNNDLPAPPTNGGRPPGAPPLGGWAPQYSPPPQLQGAQQPMTEPPMTGPPTAGPPMIVPPVRQRSTAVGE